MPRGSTCREASSPSPRRARQGCSGRAQALGDHRRALAAAAEPPPSSLRASPSSCGIDVGDQVDAGDRRAGDAHRARRAPSSPRFALELRADVGDQVRHRLHAGEVGANDASARAAGARARAWVLVESARFAPATLARVGGDRSRRRGRRSQPCEDPMEIPMKSS
jgi:hypothetical protein